MIGSPCVHSVHASGVFTGGNSWLPATGHLSAEHSFQTSHPWLWNHSTGNPCKNLVKTLINASQGRLAGLCVIFLEELLFLTAVEQTLDRLRKKVFELSFFFFFLDTKTKYCQMKTNQTKCVSCVSCF